MANTGHKEPRVVCSICGEDMAKKIAEKYHDALRCAVALAAKEMAQIGFVKVTGLHEVLLSSGVALKRAAVSIAEEGGKRLLQEGFWGPAWAVQQAKRNNELDAAARHVILHTWAKATEKQRAVLFTLSNSAGAWELLDYCLGAGRCCGREAGKLSLLWRKYERNQNSPNLRAVMGVHLMREPIGG